MESISFDRAADYYDQTRSLTDDAMSRMTRLLVDELGDAGLCLEIGVGTGRIAIPLAEHGVAIAGLDLSPKMLAILRSKTPHIPAAVGDATLMPFPDGRFDAGIACHVLHLIPEWRRAVTELTRVIRPGGKMLVNLGGWGQGVWETIQTRFVAETGIKDPRPGATEPEEVDEVMDDLGARLRVLPEVADNRRLSYGELIDRIEDGLYSFTWAAGEATRRRAAGVMRRWVVAEHGSLDELHDNQWIVSWRVYDLPGNRGPARRDAKQTRASGPPRAPF